MNVRSGRWPTYHAEMRKGPGKAASVSPDEAAPPAAEYTVNELARVAKTTVRNVRAYQDRGLLPPPERRGRKAVYGQEHLSRLRIIGQLLTRGYTLNSIGELLAAWEQGQGLGHLLGLETAVSSPWTDEVPARYSLVDLVRMFGAKFGTRWLARADELGIVQVEGAGFRAPSPRMLQAGAELAKIGIPMEDMLDVVVELRSNVEHAAEAMVLLVERHVVKPHYDGLPSAEELSELRDLIWRLRPLVEMAVHAEVARAMELAASRHLGDHLGDVLEALQKKAAGENGGSGGE